MYSNDVINEWKAWKGLKWMHFLATLLFCYLQNIIFSLLKYICFVCFFNVENKVVLANKHCIVVVTHSKQLYTALVLLPCCHWPVRSHMGQWQAWRTPRELRLKAMPVGGEYIQINIVITFLFIKIYNIIGIKSKLASKHYNINKVVIDWSHHSTGHRFL